MNILRILICLYGVFASACGRSSVTNDTDDVAIALLSYAAMDNEDDLDEDEEYPVRYTDWNGFLDGVSTPGLTRQDKETALFGYMLMQSTNDLAAVGGELRELIRIGLCEYRDLNHTNALPVVRNLMTNPSALYMNEHVYVYYKWAKLDDDYLAVTRSFLSDTSAVARASKASDFYFVSCSINRHKESYGCDGQYTNAVKIIYQSRVFCPECAEPMDRMLVSEMSGYEYSSNRLQTVIGWLGATNCAKEVVDYCTSVANLLMSAPQPLPEVEALRGL